MVMSREQEKTLMRRNINVKFAEVQSKLRDYVGPDRDHQVKNFIKCADLLRDDTRVLKYDTLEKLTYYAELMIKKLKIEH